MKVFIIGIGGGIGRRVARQLVALGHEVDGLVRRPVKGEELACDGISTVNGDLVAMSAEDLAAVLVGHDAVIFSAGAGGRDGAEATTRVDGEGPPKVAAAAKIAGVRRFILVSVYPEAWRERPMPEDFEHYIVEKKKAEIQLADIDLDWIILRPSALTNEVGRGHVAIGLAEIHGEISRDDVAATIVALLEEPALVREILEVTSGPGAIREAVSALRR